MFEECCLFRDWCEQIETKKERLQKVRKETREMHIMLIRRILGQEDAAAICQFRSSALEYGKVLHHRLHPQNRK